MKTNKHFKQQEAVKLYALLTKGKLTGTDTTCKVVERKRKKFTQVSMTFHVELEGVDLPDWVKSEK